MIQASKYKCVYTYINYMCKIYININDALSKPLKKNWGENWLSWDLTDIKPKYKMETRLANPLCRQKLSHVSKAKSRLLMNISKT